MEENKNKVLLSIKDLVVKFHVRSRILTAIRGISLDIYENESIAIVGESGSGKSVFTKTFAGMLDSNGFIPEGRIVFNDDELSATTVKKTKIAKSAIKSVKNKLNKYSKAENGAEIYNKIKDLEHERLNRSTMSDEQKEEYSRMLNDLYFKRTDLYNQKQTFDTRAERDKINETAEKIADYDAQIKALKAEIRDVIRSNRNAVNKNKEYTDKYNTLMNQYKSEYAAAVRKDISDAVKQRNEGIAKEIYLSVGRYNFLRRRIIIRKLMLIFKRALIEGVDLNDEEVRSELYDKTAYHLRYLSTALDVTERRAKSKGALADIRCFFEKCVLFTMIQTKAFKSEFFNEFNFGKDIEDDNIRRKITDDKTAFRVKFLNEDDGYLYGWAIINLAKLSFARDWNKVRGAKIATVFQDPMTSLNPIITIGKQITSVILKHQDCSEVEARARAIKLMKKVGIPNPEKRFDDYPFQYSGGMRQRIVIAIALSCQPKILICDEPTTALDVTIQAQILKLIKDLQKEFKYTIVFITHDLGVVANVADRVVVLYAGQAIEIGTVEDIFYDPKHPYTWALLSSLPQLAQRNTKLFSIAGTPPSLYNKIVGDPFAPRNAYCLKIDTLKEPPMFRVSDTHYAKTWLLDPRCPKTEKPEIIDGIHEKLIKAFNI